jgi:hypothetical protein
VSVQNSPGRHKGRSADDVEQTLAPFPFESRSIRSRSIYIDIDVAFSTLERDRRYPHSSQPQLQSLSTAISARGRIDIVQPELPAISNFRDAHDVDFGDGIDLVTSDELDGG